LKRPPGEDKTCFDGFCSIARQWPTTLRCKRFSGVAGRCPRPRGHYFNIPSCLPGARAGDRILRERTDAPSRLHMLTPLIAVDDCFPDRGGIFRNKSLKMAPPYQALSHCVLCSSPDGGRHPSSFGNWAIDPRQELRRRESVAQKKKKHTKCVAPITNRIMPERASPSFIHPVRISAAGPQRERKKRRRMNTDDAQLVTFRRLLRPVDSSCRSMSKFTRKTNTPSFTA